MKKIKFLIGLVSVVMFLTSCSSMSEVKTQTNHNILKSYTSNKTTVKTETIKLNIIKGIRETDKSLPIVLPPVVRPFWVVDHVDSDSVFVRGHWTFIKIRGFEWYIQAIENDQNINQIMKENR